MTPIFVFLAPPHPNPPPQAARESLFFSLPLVGRTGVGGGRT
jgi:hypothetical protein